MNRVTRPRCTSTFYHQEPDTLLPPVRVSVKTWTAECYAVLALIFAAILAFVIGSYWLVVVIKHVVRHWIESR